MRIRTIKPDFWRSDDVAALDIPDRLLFIGLWNYVDDAGIGVDKVAHICADLFALDMEKDPAEAFARTQRGLDALARARMIHRYTVDGRNYFVIPSFLDHQRIDRPTKSRLPQPETGPIQGVLIEDSEQLHEDSASTRGTLAAGKGKGKGNGSGKGIGKGSAEGDAAQAVIEDFPTWYAMFPKHVARAQAFKAYEKARQKATADELLEGARRYNAEVIRNKTQLNFIKHPATWLNAECWLDEAVAVMADRPKPEWGD